METKPYYAASTEFTAGLSVATRHLRIFAMRGM